MVVSLHAADKYHRLTRPTFKGLKRSIREGSQGLPAALSPLVTPSTPAMWTHVACSGHHSLPLPTTLRAHTPAGWGHGGTRKSNTSRNIHTRSVSPATIAGVQGRHSVADPVPLVGSGCGSTWRMLACGRQKLWYTWNKTSCCRKPASPLQSVFTRRPTAATCWRIVRLRRSTKAVLICQPHAAHTCWTASRAPNTTRCFTRTRRHRRTVLTTCA
jgi:hypothetical protein